MESSEEGRLGLKRLALFSWKGRTLSQLYPVLKKNKYDAANSAITKYTIMKPMPLKHYRKEIPTQIGNHANPRKSASISSIMETPGYTTVESKTTDTCITLNTKNKSLHVVFEDSKTSRPCNSCDVVSVSSNNNSSAYLRSMSQADNAKRRVRSAGMNRPRYDVEKNNRPQNYNSASQYLHGRNLTFEQNQFHNMRVENAKNKANNVYASNTIQYCGSESSKTQYVPVYYKPNNSKFATQGAVDSSDRLVRLKYDTITDIGGKMRATYGQQTANALAYGVPVNGYTIKDKIGYPNICTPIIQSDGTMKKC
jgi:hypothetical protein